MTTQERMDYRDAAHNIVDMYETDVTHDQVDAWNDYDLAEWVDGWNEGEEPDDYDDSRDVTEARSLNLL